MTGRLAALLACLVMVVSACSGSSSSADKLGYQQIANGKVVELTGTPDVGFPAMSTAPAVRVVNLWADWCTPCAQEAPILKAAHEQLAPSGVQFVSVHSEDKTSNADAKAHKRGWDWPELADPGSHTVESIPLIGLPDTLILSPSGHLVGEFVGKVPSVKALVAAVKTAQQPTA